MVRAHLQEAAIILARLANEDRPDRCLHVVVDAASADTAIEHERLIVRVKHQLLGLAEVGAHERHPAVRELHVRRLDGQRQTLKCDRLMAPVELVRLAGRKAQRYERLCRNPCPFVPPRSREPVHAVVGAVIAATTQLFEQPLGRPPFPPGQFGFFLQNPGQNLDPLAQFWRRLNATLIPELGRPPADHLAHRRARNRQRPHNLFDRQMPLEKSASYLSDLVHADHPHKPLPANTGQQKGTLTKRQRGSRLDAKNTPQGVIIASEFTPIPAPPAPFGLRPALPAPARSQPPPPTVRTRPQHPCHPAAWPRVRRPCLAAVRPPRQRPAAPPPPPAATALHATRPPPPARFPAPPARSRKCLPQSGAAPEALPPPQLAPLPGPPETTRAPRPHRGPAAPPPQSHSSARPASPPRPAAPARH